MGTARLVVVRAVVVVEAAGVMVVVVGMVVFLLVTVAVMTSLTVAILLKQKQQLKYEVFSYKQLNFSIPLLYKKEKTHPQANVWEAFQLFEEILATSHEAFIYTSVDLETTN